VQDLKVVPHVVGENRQFHRFNESW